MTSVQLAASAFVALFLVGLAVFLAPAAFELQAMGSRGGLGAGALPQFAVVVVPLLAVASLVADVLIYRRTRGFAADAAAGPAAPSSRRVLGLGTTVLAMLVMLAGVWRFAGFPIASVAFMAVLATILMPASSRTPRGYAILAATTLFFCLGTWAFFVHVLMVPLR